MMALKPFIVGNWKMHGSRSMLAEARAIDCAAQRIADVEVALAPPFPLIALIGDEASAIGIGAQDCHPLASGAYTGDVAAPLLADVGARFVIVGHSERRRDHGETDALVQAKARGALAADLAVIICVGETCDQRDAGAAESVVAAQVAGSVPADADAAAAGRLAVAYEPVWAVGTGRVAAVDDVVAMHATIRAQLESMLGEAAARVRILYGGSVNGDNAGALLAAPGVDGALIGGASLSADAFLPIVLAASRADS